MHEPSVWKGGIDDEGEQWKKVATSRRVDCILAADPRAMRRHASRESRNQGLGRRGPYNWSSFLEWLGGWTAEEPHPASDRVFHADQTIRLCGLSALAGPKAIRNEIVSLILLWSPGSQTECLESISQASQRD